MNTTNANVPIVARRPVLRWAVLIGGIAVGFATGLLTAKSFSFSANAPKAAFAAKPTQPAAAPAPATSAGFDHSAPPDHSSHFEHCPFGSAPGTGPLSNLPQVERTGLTPPPSISLFATLRLGVRLDRAHGARAPPLLA